jgi:hypothetical protein
MPEWLRPVYGKKQRACIAEKLTLPKVRDLATETNQWIAEQVFYGMLEI